MKNYLKYSIMITLTLLITIGLVNAIGPPIGTTKQTSPFETYPLTRTLSAGPAPVLTSGTLMNDGDEATFGTATVTGTTGTSAWIQFSGYGTSSFTITWVSIQIKYAHLGTTDDLFRWQYSLDGATWIGLTADATKFDSTGAAQTRSFSQIEPARSWSWADIGALRVRALLTRGGASWDGVTKKLQINEAWISVYSTPKPPTSSPTMSIQPPSVSAMDTAYDYFFVEIYCSDVTNLAGWQYRIDFDPNVVIATGEYWNYYPWTDVVIDVGTDYVNYAGTIPTTDPLVTTGLTGNFAVARVFFYVNDDGTGLPMPPNFSWLRLTMSLMGDPAAGKIPHRVYDGYYGTPPENTYVASWVPASLFPYGSPISTNWVEQFPNPGAHWHLTSWEDNGDLVLSVSDQIDMTPTTPPGPVQWFHVDQIWQSDTGIGGDQEVHMILTFKPTVPEFPLGIGILLGLAPAIPLIYLWRTRPKRRVQKQ
jgi:hypothetical protein